MNNYMSKNHIYKSQRGSAMTELLILTFPYAMILIGITVLGMFSLGKQEAKKATILASPWPGAQSFDDISGLVFTGMQDNAKMKTSFEEETDFVPEQYYADQEPVLPYRDSSESGENNDIHAGFVHIGYTARSSSNVSSGGVSTSESVVQNSTGRYLENFGIMPDMEDDIARAMNDWLEYSRAKAEFSYAYGGEAGFFEKRAEESSPDPAYNQDADIREELVLKDYDGDEGVKNFNVTRTSEDRGSHLNSSIFEFGNVDFSDVGNLPSIITTFEMSQPGTMYDSGGDGAEYDSWNIMNYNDDWQP